MFLSLGSVGSFVVDTVVGTGTAHGRSGPVTVKVSFDGDTITDLTVTETHETVGVSGAFAFGYLAGQVAVQETLG